CQQYNGLPPTF
nr:immunoglobulin light chain junction region [Macaca mulatta]